MHSRDPKPHAERDGRANLVLLAILAILGFFLLTEHRAHTLGILPFALLLLCPLLHYFMHGSHRGEQHATHRQGSRGETPATGGEP